MIGRELLPANISTELFKQALLRYAPLVESISLAKGAKPGQKTLLELDKFRYGDALSRFQSEEARRVMTHDDVEMLVEWKLRHGKFRPTLMKLVSSNEEATVKDIIEEAVTNYRSNADLPKALDTITKLKGIGPATASLLLSVHDPARVIFFSDEAFYWLCCDGKVSTIKYNPKEYRELNIAAQALVKRLEVSATDVEKVAYVLMKDGFTPQGVSTSETLDSASAAKPNKESSSRAPKKRKVDTATETNGQAPPRRSKRGKAT